jgi:histidine triad (HIT) family protein
MDKPDCVFCRILRGQIPSERVYEDDRVVAFLDISPIAPGHALVVPRHHCVNLLDAPAEVLAAATTAVTKVARGVLKATGGEGFTVVQFNGAAAGQEVMHLHFHIIPRRAGDGVSFAWRQGKYGPGEMAALGAKVRAALSA